MKVKRNRPCDRPKRAGFALAIDDVPATAVGSRNNFEQIAAESYGHVCELVNG